MRYVPLLYVLYETLKYFNFVPKSIINNLNNFPIRNIFIMLIKKLEKHFSLRKLLV